MQGSWVRMTMPAIAYVLTSALRRIGLGGAEMERAQVGTISMRPLRVATMRVTTRKVWVAMSMAWPWERLLDACAWRLLAAS